VTRSETQSHSVRVVKAQIDASGGGADRNAKCVYASAMRDIDFQNIARAAEYENIEPSAISKRMLQLEEDLSASLLVRARRGVTPTPAGLSLLEHARSILFTVDRIANDVADHNRGITGHARLVATSSAVAESLTDDLAAFMRKPGSANIKIDVEARPPGLPVGRVTAEDRWVRISGKWYKVHQDSPPPFTVIR